MRNTSILALIGLISTICISTLKAQNWQQNADYLIQVTLNAKTHELYGSLELTYTNNSPNTLDSLYFHFWPNAYSHKQTPFAKQQELVGSLDFRFAKADEMGKMFDVAFTQNGIKTDILYLDDFNEIGAIALNQPLKPGQKVSIQANFKVRVPKMYSRMGREGEHYCITQWFPKVAKYDIDGWHRMSYLDLGEYFDEFGSYSVFITVPKNYVVAATGNLQTDSEIKWLNDRIEKSKSAVYSKDYSFIQSESDSTKTLHFYEDRIHDFAWFANPNYLVSKSEIKIDTQFVETWAFYEPDEAKDWLDANAYLETSVKFYSTEVGNYPYQTVKAVAGPLSAGGGMEYPTITVISAGIGDVKRVILHEVGHNWFQGMLGTNERRFPYLDEGFNTYYENRYFNQNGGAPAGMFSEGFNEFMLRHLMARHNDMNCTLHSNKYNQLNYGLSIYQKTGYYLDYLEDYLGQSVFDSCMHTFFNKWKFKHPSPDDFKTHFETISAQNLDWFFVEMLQNDNRIDYAVKALDNQKLKLTNKNNNHIPVKIRLNDEGEGGYTEVWALTQTDTTINLGQDYESAKITSFLDVGPNNNVSYFTGHKPFKVDPFNPFYSGSSNAISFLPVLGFNTSNKALVGMAFYNQVIPQQKFQYAIAPMFGIGSKSLSWLAKMQYNKFWKTETLKKRFHIGVSSKSFGVQYTQLIDTLVSTQVFNYKRFQPYLKYKIGPKYKHHLSHEFSLRAISRNFNIPNGREYEQFWKTFLEGSYKFSNTKSSMPINVNLSVRAGDGFAQLRSEIKGGVHYNAKKDIRYRLFAGTFLQQSSAYYAGLYNFRLSNRAGFYDYLLDDLVFDRALQDNFFVKQQTWGEGGFSGPIGIFSSNSSLLALNVSAALPVTPLRFTANFAYLNNNSILKNPLQYELGLQLAIWKDIITLNLPIYYSTEINDILDLNQVGFFDRFTFTLQLHKLNPIELIQEGAGSLF
ncbi:MAG: M1 family metallopeptidase [Bacteroidia bacterium]